MNSFSAAPTSSQAASRAGSGRHASIWCSAPNDSRSNRKQSAHVFALTLVEADQQAVSGLVARVLVLIGQVAESGGELHGVLGSQPERAQHQERLGLGGGDLRGERLECHLDGFGVVVLQAANGALVVLLRSAAHLAGA